MQKPTSHFLHETISQNIINSNTYVLLTVTFPKTWTVDLAPGNKGKNVKKYTVDLPNVKLPKSYALTDLKVFGLAKFSDK